MMGSASICLYLHAMLPYHLQAQAEETACPQDAPAVRVEEINKVS